MTELARYTENDLTYIWYDTHKVEVLSSRNRQLISTTLFSSLPRRLQIQLESASIGGSNIRYM